MGAGASVPTPQNDPAAGCPVDQKTRDIWLAQNPGATPPHPSPAPTSSKPPPSSSKPTDKQNPTQAPQPPQTKQRALSQDREVSSIPRAFPNSNPSSSSSNNDPPTPYTETPSHSIPSNSEKETGQDASSGNWVYPSERQFFEALLRKNAPTSATSPKDLATSVASIIPIHNAVNERAWSEILDWESRAPGSDPGSKKCGGPRLYSFRGLGVESQFLSPRARFNGLLGYQLPFDRHDWVVERCEGNRVEYVIDFYQGRSTGGGTQGGLSGGGNGKLSFYLDVRPKLNSWEGVRMRMERLVGL
ncbi:hypothetical protein FQN54_009597 [Arachnomyces sp. PD_36]|nr:hypothetical protein FQN54_009597 [Arachnomyces sp. PD_36]